MSDPRSGGVCGTGDAIPGGMSETSALPSGQLDQLRTGGTTLLGEAGMRSAINKQPQTGAVRIGYLGFEGDKQTESFHGGSERAVLQYDSAHYDRWQAELPQSADRLVPGGFGENFVVTGMNEQNMCIGDVVQAGTALLQVTESRAPCYKLNHRFNNTDMARLTQETRRTGWLYRVLKPGVVQAGDRVEVVGRPLPDWPVARLQHFLYEEVDDIAAAEEIAQLPFLSQNFLGIFRRRIENAEVEDWGGRLDNGPIVDSGTRWLELEVAEIVDESSTVKSFRLVHPDGDPLPAFSAGSHVKAKIANAYTRSYSLTSPSDGEHFRIAVGRSENSRGGSAHMHDGVAVGDRIAVSEPKNFFPVADDAARHILVAGGIGITPFLPMVAELDARGDAWKLHYSVRNSGDAAFAAELSARYPDNFVLHTSDDPAHPKVDFDALLASQRAGDHAYCCGSPQFMSAFRTAASEWQEGTVHFEAFEALKPTNGTTAEPFTAKIASTGLEIPIGTSTTLLQGLRDAKFQIESSCETGSCGTCRVKYLSGEVQHNDVTLTAKERRTELLTCVSRARGTLRLDL